VLAHEVLEALRGVAVAAGVRGEQLIEIRQHLPDSLDVLR
jgi:hypothetical protein